MATNFFSTVLQNTDGYKLPTSCWQLNLHVFSFMATYFRSMILIRTAQAKIAPRGGIHLGWDESYQIIILCEVIGTVNSGC